MPGVKPQAVNWAMAMFSPSQRLRVASMSLFS